MKVDDDRSAEKGGVRIRGRNLRAEIDWGAPSTTRGGAGSVVGSTLTAHGADPEASVSFEVIADATVGDVEVERGARPRGGDGGVADGGDDRGELVVELGRSDDEERRLVLVEENGRFGWFAPEPGSDHVDLATSGGLESDRSAIGRIVRRTIRVIAAKPLQKVIGRTTKTLVGAYESKRHPPSLRSWSPGNYRDKNVGAPDLSSLQGGRGLLLVHGFMGSIHGSFSFDREMVSRLNSAYGGRTIAFDHPTLSVDPRRNAEDLVERLQKAQGLELDVLAHSRGGLVARELIDLAEEHGIRIRSVVFVATPNAGTPLADPEKPAGLIDTVTNLIDFVPGSDGFSVVLEMVADYVFRGALDGLDGLVAMKSGGTYINGLNSRQISDEVVLRSIAAEYEPAATAGFLQAKLDMALDAYFGQLRNDRVVPTYSTHARSNKFHVPPGRRLVIDSSRGVDHSSFWTDDRSVRQLSQWLSADEEASRTPDVPEAETDPDVELAQAARTTSVESIIDSITSLPTAAKKKYEEAFGGVADAVAPTGERPRVIVLPGIMGSHLAVDGRTVWMDALRLSGGGLADLRYAPGGAAAGSNGGTGSVEAVGLNRAYVQLIAELSKGWDVELFPYDWRDDIFASAERLAKLVARLRDKDSKRGINVVAHSMGGLVTRAFIAEHPDEWNALSTLPDSGRLVMLGTPNQGAYSIVLTLLGKELAIRGLAAIDREHTADDLLKIVTGFPGVYQLLPYRPGYTDDQWELLYDASSWDGLAPVDQDLLDGAAEFHRRLAASSPDTSRFAYVAGFGKSTPFRADFDDDKGLRIGVFAEGDGRVPHVLGQIDGMASYFVDATHGGLVQDRAVLGIIDDLVRNGTTALTAKVLDSPPARRGAGENTPIMLDPSDIDRQPLSLGVTRDIGGRPSIAARKRVMDDALSMVLGGEAEETERTRLDVSVIHGSLEQTRHPVAVGHYSFVPPEGAEQFLSRKLENALQERYELDLQAEQEGKAMVVLAEAKHRPGGAVVVGLGTFGNLTESVLAAGINDGVLRYVRQAIESGRDVNELGLSSVLIGTPGRYGLSIRSSVFAIVEGAMRALARLGSQGPRRFELNLIELYQQQADAAALVVGALPDEVDRELLRRVDLTTSTTVKTAEGGRPGAPLPDESGSPWIRVQAQLVRPETIDTSFLSRAPIQQLEVTVLSRGAQADRIRHTVDMAKIRDHVRAAIDSPNRSTSIGRLLYELLMPHLAKVELDRTESLHLLIDEQLADIPWELLASQDSGNALEALSLRVGLLRQLHSDEQRRTSSTLPKGLRALVIGDPPTNLPRLAGARSEAEGVADLLEGKGWSVSRLIYPGAEEPDEQWREIDDALHAQPYRLVHVAAHGILDEAQPERSGVVTGAGDHHRVTALDIRAMSVQPDLVFLNCCHLGRLDDAFMHDDNEHVKDSRLRQPNRTAATIARQLLANGVPAVVVAGWAVDDHAAAVFSAELYERMLDGAPYGDAVYRARRKAHQADGGRSNTWGAYQCYGNPDFQLVSGSGARRPTEPVVSEGQLIRRLETITSDAGQADTRAWRDELTRALDGALSSAGALRTRPRVALASGDALRALGQFGRAADEYERSVASPKGNTELRAIELMCNMRVRHEALRGAEADLAVFINALDTLDRVAKLAGETSERLSLRGSTFKKLAVVLSVLDEPSADLVALKIVGSADALKLALLAYEAANDTAFEATGRNDPYTGNIMLQLRYAGSTPRKARAPKDCKLSQELLENSEDNADGSVDFWQRSQLGDSLLTAAILGSANSEDFTKRRAECFESAQAVYEEAFRNRSTYSERMSVMTHLAELSALAQERGAGPDISKLHDALAQVAQTMES